MWLSELIDQVSTTHRGSLRLILSPWVRLPDCSGTPLLLWDANIYTIYVKAASIIFLGPLSWACLASLASPTFVWCTSLGISSISVGGGALSGDASVPVSRRCRIFIAVLEPAFVSGDVLLLRAIINHLRIDFVIQVVQPLLDLGHPLLCHVGSELFATTKALADTSGLIYLHLRFTARFQTFNGAFSWRAFSERGTFLIYFKPLAKTG